MLIYKEDILIRKMEYCDDDFSLMLKWLNNKEVTEYYGSSSGCSYEQILEKFGPRTLGEDYVVACMIEYKDMPIGYIQYYELTESTKNDYEIPNSNDVYGIDIFIGGTQYWNKGLGSIALRLLMEYLFIEKKAIQIFIDPQTWNERAIRSYEKCGFKKVKVLPNHELSSDGCYKDNLIMAISREDFFK